MTFTIGAESKHGSPRGVERVHERGPLRAGSRKRTSTARVWGLHPRSARVRSARSRRPANSEDCGRTTGTHHQAERPQPETPDGPRGGNERPGRVPRGRAAAERADLPSARTCRSQSAHRRKSMAYRDLRPGSPQGQANVFAEESAGLPLSSPARRRTGRRWWSSRLSRRGT